MPQCRRRNRFLTVGLLSALVWIVGTSLAAAQESGDHKSVPADAFSAADNAWVLTSSALVLMMTAPGLALFYCGLVRRKNVLSVMMQCIFLMCLMTVIWATVWLYAGLRRQGALDRRLVATSSCRASSRVERSRVAPAALSRPDDSRDDPHALPGHVLHHHAGADLRGLRRTDEVQHDGRLLDPLGHAGLLPLGPLGLGRRSSRLTAGRNANGVIGAGGALGFRRRHGGPHQFGRVGLDLRLAAGQTPGLRQGSRCRRTI